MLFPCTITIIIIVIITTDGSIFFQFLLFLKFTKILNGCLKDPYVDAVVIVIIVIDLKI